MGWNMYAQDGAPTPIRREMNEERSKRTAIWDERTGKFKWTIHHAQPSRKKPKKEVMTKDYLVWDPLEQKWRPPNPPQESKARKNRPKRLEGKARLNQVNRLAMRDGLRCKWCDVDLTIFGEDETTRATIDHYPVPKGAGGSNADSNAVLSCKPCNEDRAKGKKGKARIESRRMFVAWQRENA